MDPFVNGSHLTVVITFEFFKSLLSIKKRISTLGLGWVGTARTGLDVMILNRIQYHSCS